MLLPLDRPYSVVAVPPVQGQAPLPGASVHKIAGVGEHTPATIITTAAFRRSPGATSGLVIVKTDCISGPAYKVSGHPPLERVSCAPRAAPCAAASLFRCAGTIDDDADSLQASEEERVWAEDTLDRYEARCRAAGLAAVRRVG